MTVVSARSLFFSILPPTSHPLLLSASEFREIVSGRRRGMRAALWRAALRVAEVPYTAVVRYRNRQFDRVRNVEQAGVPVVSIGNLTLGGTGKTPMVEWLSRWFASRGVRVALVSRGYGAQAGQANDEARELAEKLPGVPHFQNPRRIVATCEAIAAGCQLVILDDGFQHRRLARDLDIVLVDALEPLGFGHVFPRGTLREPLAGFARAQLIALTRADLVDAATRSEIRAQVERYAPGVPWMEVAHAPRALRTAAGDELPLETLRGQRVAAFCGIGNPAGFRHSLENCGCQIVAWREFADHHAYSASDIKELTTWANSHDVQMVVCTHKDLVKLSVEKLGDTQLFALAIGLKILSGEEHLVAKLEPLVAKALRQ